jgi:isocitrate dehydrogenase (NAD+)
MATHNLLLLPGDGIGPEVMAEVKRVIDFFNKKGSEKFTTQEALVGGCCYDAHKVAITDATMEKAKAADAVIFGAVGGPKWDKVPYDVRPEAGLLRLRKDLDLYANVRPARSVMPGGRFENVDIVLIRENTEGLYSGIEHFIAIGPDPRAAAESTAIVTRYGSERIIRYAFEYAVKHARKKVTLVHKANILKMTGGLFLEVGQQVAKDFAGRVAYEERIVDAMAMQLVIKPEVFDVVVTTNLFGDILSDLISGLVGGLGLAPGANLGTTAAIFEAVHGTAPDIAGKGIANPGALVYAACLMLEHLGDQARARKIRDAMESVIREEKTVTRDLGGTATTAQFTDAIITRLA